MGHSRPSFEGLLDPLADLQPLSAPRVLSLQQDKLEESESFTAPSGLLIVKTLPLPARSPNLNAHAERWVRSVKEECLSRLILFGEASLRRALSEFTMHYHAERNHQGKGNVLLFPVTTDSRHVGPVQCRERLGGLLRYYHRQAA